MKARDLDKANKLLKQVEHLRVVQKKVNTGDARFIIKTSGENPNDRWSEEDIPVNKTEILGMLQSKVASNIESLMALGVTEVYLFLTREHHQ